MKASPRFRDGAFVNTAPVAQGLKKGTATPTIAEFLCGGQRLAPRAPLPSRSPLSGWQRAPETGLRATWLGPSSVLLGIGGGRGVPDPAGGARASPVAFAGPRRFQPVPLAVSELPGLDAVSAALDH